MRLSSFCMTAFLLTIECCDWNSLLYLSSSSFYFWSNYILANESVNSKSMYFYLRLAWIFYPVPKIRVWWIFLHRRKYPYKYWGILLWAAKTYRILLLKALETLKIKLLSLYFWSIFRCIILIFELIPF